MNRLPVRPHVDHLKKQAKDLLAACRGGEDAALSRLAETFPPGSGHAVPHDSVRLHHAQRCVAQEYGFSSWAALTSFVVAQNAQSADRAAALRNWLRLVYPADISGGMNRASPAAAARILADDPELVAGDPVLACAIGDEAALRGVIDRDPEWVNRPGGPLRLPPLLAVTHSSLLRLPEFRDRLHASAKLLLKAGADPNQTVGSRWPPASVDAPDWKVPLSALYGAAGQNHDAELTKILLEAGADPNDGESLYHSLESPACTRLLLEAGAKVTGSNALYRVLDLDNLESLQLLLASGGDPNEPARNWPITDWGTPLLWAIRRRRSPGHIAALLAAGADPLVRTPDGTTPYVLALRFGLTEVADLLRPGASSESLPDDERFLAACAAGDEPTARRIQADRPDLPAALSPVQLRLLPELAAQGCRDAVKLMVLLGWPIAARGGDWKASALNHAVFRGDADLTRFLLERGASWQEVHGYGDNASGTLSWGSLNQPEGAGDWPGCATALLAHGMPAGTPDPAGTDGVVVDGNLKWFSEEVREVLLGSSPDHPVG